MLTLAVQSRGADDSLDGLRKNGLIPAVFYGPKEASTPISINGRELEQVWKQAGYTSVVTLSGVGESKDTLIHDVQMHPVSGSVLHADFYVLEKGKKVKIAVPLEFVGQAPAEKAGHIIVKALHEIEIEVAPAELPHKLEVDLSKLESVGDHILASDIALPPSAALITQGDEIVASVTEFKEEKEQAPAAAPAEAAAPGAEAPASEPATTA
jgi:large subunit ribosomal protein L25